MDINEIRASTERAFDRWLAAMSTFDYFIMTVAAALLAYIAKDYHPRKLDSWLDLFDPVSMLLFIAAFVAGARRVELAAHILVLEVERGKCQVKIEKYLPGLTSSGPGVDSETGEAVGKIEAQEAVAAQRARLKVIAEATSKAVQHAATYYRARFRLLALGILMLLVGRMLAPYFPAPTGTASGHQRPAATAGPTGAPAKPP